MRDEFVWSLCVCVSLSVHLVYKYCYSIYFMIKTWYILKKTHPSGALSPKPCDIIYTYSLPQQHESSNSSTIHIHNRLPRDNISVREDL